MDLIFTSSEYLANSGCIDVNISNHLTFNISKHLLHVRNTVIKPTKYAMRVGQISMKVWTPMHAGKL